MWLVMVVYVMKGEWGRVNVLDCLFNLRSDILEISNYVKNKMDILRKK